MVTYPSVKELPHYISQNNLKKTSLYQEAARSLPPDYKKKYFLYDLWLAINTAEASHRSLLQCSLSDAFYWDSTPQGSFFWHILQDECAQNRIRQKHRELI